MQFQHETKTVKFNKLASILQNGIFQLGLIFIIHKNKLKIMKKFLSFRLMEIVVLLLNKAYRIINILL